MIKQFILIILVNSYLFLCQLTTHAQEKKIREIKLSDEKIKTILVSIGVDIDDTWEKYFLSELNSSQEMMLIKYLDTDTDADKKLRQQQQIKKDQDKIRWNLQQVQQKIEQVLENKMASIDQKLLPWDYNEYLKFNFKRLKEGILSYFTWESLVKRLEHGDPYILDSPSLPLKIVFNHADGPWEITNYSSLSQSSDEFLSHESKRYNPEENNVGNKDENKAGTDIQEKSSLDSLHLMKKHGVNFLNHLSFISNTSEKLNPLTFGAIYYFTMKYLVTFSLNTSFQDIFYQAYRITTEAAKLSNTLTVLYLGYLGIALYSSMQTSQLLNQYISIFLLKMSRKTHRLANIWQTEVDFYQAYQDQKFNQEKYLEVLKALIEKGENDDKNDLAQLMIDTLKKFPIPADLPASQIYHLSRIFYQHAIPLTPELKLIFINSNKEKIKKSLEAWVDQKSPTISLSECLHLDDPIQQEVGSILPMSQDVEKVINFAKLSDSSKQFSCCVCDEEKTYQEVYQPIHCHCPSGRNMCKDCFHLMIQHLGQDHFPLLCPLGCRGEIKGEDLRQLNCSTSWIENYELKTLKNKISKLTNWENCPTADCVGGRWKETENNKIFHCPACFMSGCIQCGLDHLGNCQEYSKVKEQFHELLEKGKECPPKIFIDDPNHPDFLLGRFRPCYHCGKITERIDGCNSINCRFCLKTWHWNKGNSTSHDFTKDKMRFTPLIPPRL